MSSQLITIKNGGFTAQISTMGAELQSLKSADGTEYIWQGDPDVWGDRAPILFPICGGLKEDKYVFEGKEYTIPKHGYALKSEFEVESVADESATFLLKSSEETKKVFPFDYELRVTYVLKDNGLDTKYSVTNKSDKNMFFSIGAHEGYACPEGVEEYSLCFDKKEVLTHNELHGNLLSDDVKILGDGIDELPLNYDYFKVDALTFLNLKSRAITLKHKDGNRRVRIDFPGFDYVFVWTMAGKYGKYVCIEPWCGIPDFEGTSYDFTKKKGINEIGAGETFDRIHTITIE